MTNGVIISNRECIGCGTCVDICPAVFGFDESETVVHVNEQAEDCESCIEEAMEACPERCISWMQDDAARCEMSVVICSGAFAFNENDEMVAVNLPEGSFQDCMEETINTCDDDLCADDILCWEED
jgi:ferredoxin